MICILRMKGGEISGWIIATDMRDACHRAKLAGDTTLAEILDQIGSMPRGKHVLPNGDTILVQ